MIYAFPELYNEQYQSYRDDLRFYADLAQDYGAPVLELGAGTARVSMHLAKVGFKVKGLELSAEMIRSAHERIKEAKLSSLIDMQEADMRKFNLSETFSLIIAPFNALMHLYSLKDQDAALRCVKQHLKPDGVFAFDLYNPQFVHLEQLTKVDEWAQLGGTQTELFLYQSHDQDKQILSSTYYLDELQEDGFLKRKIATLKQRYYHRFELERALQQAGFEHLRFFGDFDRSPYSADAPHLIVLAKV